MNKCIPNQKMLFFYNYYLYSFIYHHFFKNHNFSINPIFFSTIFYISDIQHLLYLFIKLKKNSPIFHRELKYGFQYIYITLLFNLINTNIIFILIFFIINFDIFIHIPKNMLQKI